MSLNVCKEILDEMTKLNIKKEIIDFIKNNHLFISNYNSDSHIQKVTMTTILFKSLMTFKYPVPSQIRLALNAANNVNDWVKDVKLYILPFIKENEEFFNV